MTMMYLGASEEDNEGSETENNYKNNSHRISTVEVVDSSVVLNIVSVERIHPIVDGFESPDSGNHTEGDADF